MNKDEEEKMLKRLREKLGAEPKKENPMTELERLFGKKEDSPEMKLKEKFAQKGPQVNDELTVSIKKLSYSGMGLAVLPGNINVFVPRQVPGDTVKVRITNIDRNNIFTRRMSLVAPSSDRTKPKCPLFDKCSHCSLMNYAYSAQVQAKTQIVKDLCRSVEGLERTVIHPFIRSPEIYGYRTSDMLSVKKIKGRFIIGWPSVDDDNRLEEISECPLLAPVLNSVLGLLPDILKRYAKEEKIYNVVLKTNSEARTAILSLISEKPLNRVKQILEAFKSENIPVKGIRSGSKSKLVDAGEPFIEETVGSFTYYLSPVAHFPANRHLLKKYGEQAIRLSSPTQRETIAAIQAGPGFPALAASRYAAEILAAEWNRPESVDLKKNIDANSIKNIRIFKDNFKNLIKKEPFRTAEDISSAWLLPSKQKNAPGIADYLTDRQIPKLLYVNEEPQEFVRDLKKLTQGDYRLRVIQPVDMEPHTHRLCIFAFCTHRYTAISAASEKFVDLK